MEQEDKGSFARPAFRVASIGKKARIALAHLGAHYWPIGVDAWWDTSRAEYLSTTGGVRNRGIGGRTWSFGYCQ